MLKGAIFDIQHNCVYDGPGIRTTVFFKGCPLRCAWCHNPESQLLQPQISHFSEKCASCGECVKSCHSGALRFVNGKPSRNSDKCVVCGKCAAACPTHATELIGHETTVDDILGKVLPDMPFYKNSGGGATISGGEPTMQKDFLLALSYTLKNSGIHVALETCGQFKPDIVPELCDAVDLFLFDIKTADPQSHKTHTGLSNERIIENFSHLIHRAGCERITPRIPLIDDVNASPESIRRIIDLLRNTKYTGAVHLMPYNATARTKWQKIGREHEYTDFPPLSADVIQRVTAQFQNEGFEVFCNK